jgi:hypothetical protein
MNENNENEALSSTTLDVVGMNLQHNIDDASPSNETDASTTSPEVHEVDNHQNVPSLSPPALSPSPTQQQQPISNDHSPFSFNDTTPTPTTAGTSSLRHVVAASSTTVRPPPPPPPPAEVITVVTSERHNEIDGTSTTPITAETNNVPPLLAQRLQDDPRFPEERFQHWMNMQAERDAQHAQQMQQKDAEIAELTALVRQALNARVPQPASPASKTAPTETPPIRPTVWKVEPPVLNLLRQQQPIIRKHDKSFDDFQLEVRRADEIRTQKERLRQEAQDSTIGQYHENLALLAEYDASLFHARQNEFKRTLKRAERLTRDDNLRDQQAQELAILDDEHTCLQRARSKLEFTDQYKPLQRFDGESLQDWDNRCTNFRSGWNGITKDHFELADTNPKSERRQSISFSSTPTVHQYEEHDPVQRQKKPLDFASAVSYKDGLRSKINLHDFNSTPRHEFPRKHSFQGNSSDESTTLSSDNDDDSFRKLCKKDTQRTKRRAAKRRISDFKVKVTLHKFTGNAADWIMFKQNLLRYMNFNSQRNDLDLLNAPERRHNDMVAVLLDKLPAGAQDYLRKGDPFLKGVTLTSALTTLDREYLEQTGPLLAAAEDALGSFVWIAPESDAVSSRLNVLNNKKAFNGLVTALAQAEQITDTKSTLNVPHLFDYLCAQTPTKYATSADPAIHDLETRRDDLTFNDLDKVFDGCLKSADTQDKRKKHLSTASVAAYAAIQLLANQQPAGDACVLCNDPVCNYKDCALSAALTREQNRTFEPQRKKQTERTAKVRTTTETPRDTSKDKCFNCGKNGHHRPDCPQPDDGKGRKPTSTPSRASKPAPNQTEKIKALEKELRNAKHESRRHLQQATTYAALATSMDQNASDDTDSEEERLRADHENLKAARKLTKANKRSNTD